VPARCVLAGIFFVLKNTPLDVRTWCRICFFEKKMMTKKLIINVLCIGWLLVTGGVAHGQVTVGAERMDTLLPLLEGRRVALVVNHSSLVGTVHLADTLLRRGVRIQRIFAPEHGFRGLAEAGETVRDQVDTRTGIALVSLYGKKKKPTQADLADVDVVVFDIQDVGVRFYTYSTTLLHVAEACAAHGVRLVVLDRPNPNGHYVDGPVLVSSLRSFVGRVPVPIVHGCTLGELLAMSVGEGWIDDAKRLDYQVVTCLGYTHSTRYDLPVRPSPNLPDQRSVLLYPSVCLFEGTKVSVGRGTDTPFQRFGYPEFPAGAVEFVPCPNPGAKNPLYEGQFCAGFDLSAEPLDSLYAAARVDLTWLLLFFEKSPRKDDFFLKSGFFDQLAGTRALRVQVESGNSAAQIRTSWQPELERYRATRRRYLRYAE
jgi:uncharacterized protein YbbC (DUF1343 family)